MNFFTYVGDLLHLASIFILLLKIYAQRNCRGISLKTQALYLAVFVCRYLDVFWHWNPYLTSMKLIYIGSSAAIVYLMRFRKPISTTYDAAMDNMRVEFLVAPCAVLALLFTAEYSFSEVLWTFSIICEAVAITPQLLLVHKYAAQQNGFVENLTSHYVFALGGYRLMYLFNWVYRFMTEPGYRAWLTWVAGVVQSVIYMDFFYYYVQSTMKGQNMALPM